MKSDKDFQPITDIEELVTVRVEQKFKKFSTDVLCEHEKTRKTVKEAVEIMKKTKLNNGHIIMLYVLNIALFICYFILMIG